ncbi:MAG TPA: hypothetical protein VFB34_01710 [Chloroflexota bacterium]|nr:hypothetical protein [Chloroflexota bacterium]
MLLVRVAIAVGAVLLAVPASGSAAKIRPAGKMPIISTTVTDGLKITLVLPQSSYPKNALAATLIKVRNVSSNGIKLAAGQCFPPIHTDVLNKHGKPFSYPDPFKPPSCGLSGGGRTLKPGQHVRLGSVVVLRSGNLRPSVLIQAKSTTVTALGKVVKLKLSHAGAEHIALTSGSNGSFIASITPALSHAGPLYVALYETCKRANGSGQVEGLVPGTWQQRSGSTVSTDVFGPGCVRELWHLVAGWIGFPAAKLDLSISSS